MPCRCHAKKHPDQFVFRTGPVNDGGADRGDCRSAEPKPDPQSMAPASRGLLKKNAPDIRDSQWPALIPCLSEGTAQRRGRKPYDSDRTAAAGTGMAKNNDRQDGRCKAAARCFVKEPEPPDCAPSRPHALFSFPAVNDAAWTDVADRRPRPFWPPCLKWRLPRRRDPALLFSDFVGLK